MDLLAQAPGGMEGARIDPGGIERLRLRRGGSILRRAPPIAAEQRYDCSHPKAHGVSRSIPASLRKSNVCGRVLIAGIAPPHAHSAEHPAWPLRRYIAKYENATDARMQLRLRRAPVMVTSDFQTCARAPSP